MQKRKPHVKNAAKKAALKLKQVLKSEIEKKFLSKEEAKELVSGVLAELRAERERIVSFAKKEFCKELKKARPLVKKALKRVRRRA